MLTLQPKKKGYKKIYLWRVNQSRDSDIGGITLNCLLLLPDRVLNVLIIEGQKEAKDGKEHDRVGGDHQSTRSSRYLYK